MKKKRLGVSLYPEFAPLEENLSYLERAAAKGFDVLFLALLAGKDSRDEVLARYKPICDKANELGFEIDCDVNPMVFKRLGVNASMFQGPIDLSFFTELGVDVMRLDLGMTSFEEVALANNKFGIKVCINGASVHDHVGELLSMGADPDRLLGCHNYYPQRYTGVSLDFFEKGSANWAKRNMRLQAFVSSLEPKAFGPWPVTEGLPTLEMHRDLPIEVQTRHMMLLPGITDILIGNAFASDAELDAMAAANDDCLVLDATAVPGLPVEQLEHASTRMSRRGDCGDYMVRTLESRFKHPEVEPFNTVDVKRGDVTIANKLYGQYHGELHLALKDMKNDGKTNVVGHIDEAEHILLDYMTGSCAFRVNFR